MLSPADGRIVAVERARDPYLERDALKISVFMNVFNVHSQPQPGGRRGAASAWYHAGRVLQRGARQGLARQRAQRAVDQHGRAGRDVTCVQIAGLIARRILCYVERGRRARARPALRLHPLRLARGRLPAARRASPASAIGDKVYATETDARWLKP